LFGHIGGAIKYGAGAAVGGLAYLGRQSAQKGFNVQIGGKNKPPPGFKKYNNPVFNLVAQNEAIAAQRRNQWNGANESERPVSFAGALTAVAGAGAIHGAGAAKRARNLSQAAKTGFYSAKTLRHAVRR
jgi:hypothetical protein